MPETGSFQSKEAVLQKLLSLPGQSFWVKKGTYLFQEGMEAGGLYIILQGKVQVTKSAPDGRELSFGLCKEQDLVGGEALFSSFGTYHLSAQTLEESHIFFIQKGMLEQGMIKEPAFTMDLLRWLSDQNRKNQTKLRDLILYGKKGAFYSTLIRLSNTCGKKIVDGILIDYSFTNQEIANFCGTTRESVNRMLSELKHEQVISVLNGKIVIHQLEKLKKEIHCENCPVLYCQIN